MLNDMVALPRIAYFSMEIALETHIPTYSGGLGVLAGDTLRSAADLGLPMMGVTLLHRKGYFFQRDGEGRQYDDPPGPIDDFLPDGCPARCRSRPAGERPGLALLITGFPAEVPVFLLDTDVPENDPRRTLTDSLYCGDERYRLCQEVVLGVGGVRLLRALGYTQVGKFHMNEGHAALLALELFAEELQSTPRAKRP
jgi:starch phosphorylase